MKTTKLLKERSTNHFAHHPENRQASEANSVKESSNYYVKGYFDMKCVSSKFLAKRFVV